MVIAREIGLCSFFQLQLFVNSKTESFETVATSINNSAIGQSFCLTENECIFFFHSKINLCKTFKCFTYTCIDISFWHLDANDGILEIFPKIEKSYLQLYKIVINYKYHSCSLTFLCRFRH